MNILMTTAGGIEKLEMIKYFDKLPIIKSVVAVDAADNFDRDIKHQVSSKVKFEVIPRADTNPSGCKKSLKSLVEDYMIDLILPIDNRETILVNELISEGLNVKSSSPLQVDRSHLNKSYHFDGLSRNHFVDRYLQITEEARVEDIIDGAIELVEHGNVNGIVIKPDDANGSRGVKIFHGDIDNLKVDNRYGLVESGDLFRYYILLNKFKNSIIQPFYEGQTYNVDCYKSKSGEIHVTIQMVLGDRWGQVKNTKLLYDNDIDEIAEKIYSTFNYEGCINFELAENDKKGLRLVEINPRLSAVVPQHLGTEASVVDLFIQDQMGIEYALEDSPRYCSSMFTTLRS